jgi:hypothetical protein
MDTSPLNGFAKRVKDVQKLKEDGNIEFKTGKLKKLSGMLRGFFIS